MAWQTQLPNTCITSRICSWILWREITFQIYISWTYLSHHPTTSSTWLSSRKLHKYPSIPSMWMAAPVRGPVLGLSIPRSCTLRTTTTTCTYHRSRRVSRVSPLSHRGMVTWFLTSVMTNPWSTVKSTSSGKTASNTTLIELNGG